MPKITPQDTSGRVWEYSSNTKTATGLSFDQATSYAVRGVDVVQLRMLQVMFIKSLISLDQLNWILFGADDASIPF